MASKVFGDCHDSDINCDCCCKCSWWSYHKEVALVAHEVFAQGSNMIGKTSIDWIKLQGCTDFTVIRGMCERETHWQTCSVCICFFLAVLDELIGKMGLVSACLIIFLYLSFRFARILHLSLWTSSSKRLIAVIRIKHARHQQLRSRWL